MLSRHCVVATLLVAAVAGVSASDDRVETHGGRPSAAARVDQPTEPPPGEAAGPSSARFRIRYDGSTDEPLGLAVLRILDGAWAEYRHRLGAEPKAPVTVVLQTQASFRDTTRAPEWAAGWNDGSIRLPVRGLAAPTPDLVRVLRHELAHSFVAAAAGSGCPIWLHEGVAQWLEGGDPEREDARLAARARTRRLPRLRSLETTFVHLQERQAADAYAVSLSAVAHVVRLRGEPGLRRLLEDLGNGYGVEDAIPRALGITYADLQLGWWRHVRMARATPAAPAGPRR